MSKKNRRGKKKVSKQAIQQQNLQRLQISAGGDARAGSDPGEYENGDLHNGAMNGSVSPPLHSSNPTNQTSTAHINPLPQTAPIHSRTPPPHLPFDGQVPMWSVPEMGGPGIPTGLPNGCLPTTTATYTSQHTTQLTTTTHYTTSLHHTPDQHPIYQSQTTAGIAINGGLTNAAAVAAQHHHHIAQQQHHHGAYDPRYAEQCSHQHHSHHNCLAAAEHESTSPLPSGGLDSLNSSVNENSQISPLSSPNSLPEVEQVLLHTQLDPELLEKAAAMAVQQEQERVHEAAAEAATNLRRDKARQLQQQQQLPPSSNNPYMVPTQLLDTNGIAMSPIPCLNGLDPQAALAQAATACNHIVPVSAAATTTTAPPVSQQQNENLQLRKAEIIEEYNRKVNLLNYKKVILLDKYEQKLDILIAKKRELLSKLVHLHKEKDATENINHVLYAATNGLLPNYELDDYACLEDVARTRIISEIQQHERLQHNRQAKEWIRERINNLTEEDRLRLTRLNDHLKKITQAEFTRAINPRFVASVAANQQPIKSANSQNDTPLSSTTTSVTQEEELSQEAIATATTEQQQQVPSGGEAEIGKLD